MNKNIYLLLVTMLLSSCASTPMLSDYDVRKAENHNQLQDLYGEIEETLAQKKIKSDVLQNRQQYQVIVSRKIAEQKERELLAALDHDVKKHDIARLQQALDESQAIESYNREIYLQLAMTLREAITEKERLIREKQFTLTQLDDRQAVEKVQLFDEITQIYGGEAGQQTQAKKQQYIEELFTQSALLLKQQRNEDAQKYLDTLRLIVPNDPRIAELQHVLIAQQYEQAFWENLSKGKTDEAFRTYRHLLTIPHYLDEHEDIRPIAEDMRQYFVAQGNKYMRNFALMPAYQAFSRAHYIDQTLAQDSPASAGQQKLLAHIEKQAEQFIKEKKWPVAYAYLALLAEFDAENALVNQHAADVNQALLLEANNKMLVEHFSTINTASKLDSQLYSALTKRLQSASLNFTLLGTMDTTALANKQALYRLQGEILDTHVSSQTLHEKEIKVVQTSTQQVENPDYIAWTQLNKREQKNTPQPIEIITVPYEEAVQIQQLREKKTADLSVSYRIVDMQDNLLFADAIKVEKTLETLNSDAVEQGLFQQAAVQQTMPNNLELLAELADNVAEQLSTKVIDKMQHMSTDYAQQAQLALNAEQFNQAIRYYAYADILAKAKQQPHQMLSEQLRLWSLRWK